MKNVVGNEKQEYKISEMANIAHERFPDISKMIFKGVFRYGVDGALSKFKFEHWNEIANQELSVKTQFFKSILDHSTLRLFNIGLTEIQVNSLVNTLNEENKKFLAR